RARRRRFSGGLLEQPQYVLIRLSGERQRRSGELLARLQGQQVGALFIGVRERQVVGAGLQRVDHRLGEILANLHRLQIRAQRLRLRAQGRQRGGELRRG